MAESSLDTIRIKVRRLTRSLSESILTTEQIDQYINTFVLYDFPEHLRLFNLKTTFEFFTDPYVDVYETSLDVDSPLYDFKNKYLTVEPPVYVAGFQSQFFESRDAFFQIYPMINSIASIGVTGNGVAQRFTGVINTQQAIVPPNITQNICLVRNNVLFSSIDINNDGLSMIDFPINASIGNLYVPGTAPTSTIDPDPDNFINYVTGQFAVTFVVAPRVGVAINSQTVPVQPSLPQSVLFFDGKFTLRPVPDQPYRINMEVFVRPTELLAEDQSPELQEWWQYIAYGASKKVFEDRMDMESVQMIMPEFKMQETLILRRTIVQQTSQRTPTIYSQNNSGGFGWYNGGGWWQ